MTANVSPAALHPVVPAFPAMPASSAPLRIALVNNMPDAALAATERQFRHLVDQAGSGFEVDIQVFFFAETPRSEAGRAYCNARYAPVAELMCSDVDALIVTGSEPRTAVLSDEPFWHSFARLVDWARDNTVSTLWSCLAAHAAVLHLDGIERRRLPHKLSGLYGCEQVADHPLWEGLSRQVLVPHSRYNDLNCDDLLRAGYDVLSSSKNTGVDTFVKQVPSLFVFCQGHPEYDLRSLALEYRRDVGRYLAGERDTWPGLPDGYFDAVTQSALAAFAQNAVRARDPAFLGRLPDLEIQSARSAAWRDSARRIYGNWLALVAERTAGTLRPQAAML